MSPKLARISGLLLVAAVLFPLACAPAAAPAPVKPAPTSESTAPVRATAAPVAPAASAPPAPVKVQLGSQNSATDAAAYVAYERGYFQQNGIDLEFVNFSSGSEMVPALATEQIDAAGLGANPATWNAVARGVRLKIVLDKGSFTPGRGTTALVVRKAVYDAGRGRTLADLRGLNIAMTPPGKATTNACAMASAMQRVGGSLDDFTIQPLPFPDQVAALANGSIDGALIAEPFLSRALKQGSSTLVMPQDEMYPNFTVGFVGFSPTLYADRPTAAAFVRSYVQGIRDYVAATAGRTGDDDRARIDAIMAKHTGIDVGVLREVIPTGLNPNGVPNVDSMVYCYGFFRELGLIPEPVSDAAMAAVWGTELVEEVVGQMGWQ